MDLSRCARGYIGPPAHGTGALESVPGSHHGVGRAGGRAPRSRVPGVARQHERPPPPGLRERERFDSAGQWHRVGRNGSVIRELRTAGRPRRGRRQRGVRRTDVRGGVPPGCRGRSSGCRVGTATRSGASARGTPVSGDHRSGARRDVDGRTQRRRAAGSRQGNGAPAGRHGDVPRGHPGGRRRLGGGHRLQRHPEMPRRPARALPPHGLGPGHGPAGRAAVELVPRPQPPRSLRQRQLGRRAVCTTTRPRWPW